MASSARAWQILQRIADAQTPAVSRAFLRALEQVQKATDLVTLALAIERGDLPAVDAALMTVTTTRELRKAIALLRAATIEAMRDTVRVAQGTTLSAVFAQANARAVQAATEQGARLVTRVTADTRKAIRALIAESVAGGLTPQQAAQQMRPLIGLTTSQARAVQRYRRTLEAAGATDIDAKAARYAARLLRQRATTIARTETMAAVNRGQQAVWKAQQAAGLLPPDAKRRWIVTPDDRLCPLCAPMSGQTVGLDEPFTTPLGAVMTPPLHPNCRCAIGLDAATLAPARTMRVAA